MEKHFLKVGFKIKSIDIQETPEGKFGFFEGYASTFGNIDRVRDVVMKGAFKRCIENNKKIKMLWQHKYSELIGSYTEMSEDDTGLLVKGRINLGTEKGREAYALMKAGDLDSMSIGYWIIDYEIKDDVCYLKEIDLFEISLVTEPANPEAVITAVKNMSDNERKEFIKLLNVEPEKSIEKVKEIKDIELYLKNKGCSNKEARCVISKIKELQCDVEGDDNNDQCDVEELLKSVDSFNSLFK